MLNLAKLVATFVALFQLTNALHFYVRTGETKCFFEELQQDTLVVGRIDAYEKDEHSNEYSKNGRLKVQITIDETFDNNHRVIDQKSSPSGEFTFTSLDSGEHKFCLTPVYSDNTHNKVHRIFFDVVQGSTHDYVDSKSTKSVDDLTARVNGLYEKLDKIHWEQETMREREALFRDQSESTNSRVVKWSIMRFSIFSAKMTTEDDLRRKIELLELENERLKKTSSEGTHPYSKVDGWFSLDEYKRYGRQMIVPEFGSLESQKKLKSSKVLVVGTGGLGSPALEYLSAAGVGTIGIVDDDVVDTSNLHRQVIHQTGAVGTYKCESARYFITRINPHVQITTYPIRLSNDNAFEVISKYDLVLDCTDHPAVRYLINDVCVILGKTIVSGSGLKSDGQFTILNFENEGPCYRCFYPQPPSPSSVTSCADGGVIGPAIGMVGVAMAMETIKIITRYYTKKNFSPFLSSYSAYPYQQIRRFKMRPRQQNCLVCGANKEVTKEKIESGQIDYVSFCGKVIYEPLEQEYRISVADYNALSKTDSDHTNIR
ncbi:cnxF [Candida theae]|uniref:CnxF n=1 Tax=Candida theae TaxID=1198502 RepID=A0AAD5FXP0_9ASCO|nr:cnxF [Candida theae]KAI5955475.1 cnxF [Candida theae]